MPAPERWAGLAWHFYETAERAVFGIPDAAGRTWRLRTIRDVVRGFGNVHPQAASDSTGQLCTGLSVGPLFPLTLRCGPLFITGKDRVGFKSDDPQEALGGDEAPAEI
jgi:hypothetical protein